MDQLNCREFKAGRRFVGRLPHGGDIIESVESFCRDKSIAAGTINLIGAVSAATLGAYDQNKQEYGTWQVAGDLEIVSCTGNISLKDGAPFLHAHILLADEKGKTVGGHLFAGTKVFAGEVEIVEHTGEPFERGHDQTTGLMLWKM